MKRLTLTLLATSFALAPACDLKEESLGDTGDSESMSATDTAASDSDSDSDASDSDPGNTTTPTDSDPTDPTDPANPTDPTGASCTEAGCEDGVSVTLTSTAGFADGSYQVRLFDGTVRVELESCSFFIEGGSIADADCGYVAEEGADILIQFGAVSEVVAAELLIDGQRASDDAGPVEAEPFRPNGPGCEPICSQASITLPVALGTATCEDLQESFDAARQEVVSCTDPSECGQVITGYSCGCTRDLVGRLDADPTEMNALAAQGQAAECDWAGFPSNCDCPAADGFDCIDNVCSWNYL